MQLFEPNILPKYAHEFFLLFCSTLKSLSLKLTEKTHFLVKCFAVSCVPIDPKLKFFIDKTIVHQSLKFLIPMIKCKFSDIVMFKGNWGSSAK